jgi:hypothetical protein
LYQEYFIPANFTDAGKLFGLFEIRNALEAVAVSIPLLFVSLAFVPLDLTWRIIVGITLVVPAGGFALIGLYDDCLSRFARTLWQFRSNRRIISYRGDCR